METGFYLCPVRMLTYLCWVCRQWKVGGFFCGSFWFLLALCMNSGLGPFYWCVLTSDQVFSFYSSQSEGIWCIEQKGFVARVQSCTS